MFFVTAGSHPGFLDETDTEQSRKEKAIHLSMSALGKSKNSDEESGFTTSNDVEMQDLTQAKETEPKSYSHVSQSDAQEAQMTGYG